MRKLRTIKIEGTMSKVIESSLATDTKESLSEGEWFSDFFTELDDFFHDVTLGKISIENIMKKCKEFQFQICDWNIVKENITPEYEDVEIEKDEDDYLED